jgi:hypothetical protein
VRHYRFVFLLALACLVSFPALPNGGKAKKLLFQSYVISGQGQWRFQSEILPEQYRLTSVQNKYKMVQVHITNLGGGKLVLSRKNDKVEVKLGSRIVPCIVDIPGVESAYWDGLPADLRDQLAYPVSVDTGEEETIFALVPQTDNKDVPSEIRYTIASQKSPVVMKAQSSVVSTKK